MSILEIYNSKCNDNSDICQHLPTLKQYSEKVDSIIELGARSIVSTWAFLMGNPKSLISLDIKHPSTYIEYDPDGCNLELVYSLSKESGIYFAFIEGDSVTTRLPECDLMFFDTLHTQEQLSAELKAHGLSVKKYMIFHDTETYKNELLPAIFDFQKGNPQWKTEYIWTNNNGLAVLKNENQ